MADASIWEPGTPVVVSLGASGDNQVPELITAIAAQTLFNIQNFVYVMGSNALRVSINGVEQVPGRDYLEVSSTSFQTTSPCAAGDDVLVWGTIGSPDTQAAATAASNAAASAATASAAVTAIGTSVADAAASATAAAASATGAATSASNAAGSAAGANGFATSASTNASLAFGHANNAATSATAALASENAASTSASNAAASAAAAAGVVATHAALTATHGVTGAIVGTTDAQALTNKTISGLTVTTTTGTLTVSNGKTLAASASITIAGTDGKTLTVSNNLTLAGTDATTMTFPLESANIGYLSPPGNNQHAAYQFVLADAGKMIYRHTGDSTARTYTIPANASVAFPVGTLISIVNDGTAGNITIAIISDTLVLMPGGGTGSRTLAVQNIAFIKKITATRWVIHGTSGLT